MKVKAKLKNGIVKVKCMAKHDMTTYDIAEKKTGNRDDANFITHMTAAVNGEIVFESGCVLLLRDQYGSFKVVMILLAEA